MLIKPPLRLLFNYEKNVQMIQIFLATESYSIKFFKKCFSYSFFNAATVTRLNKVFWKSPSSLMEGSRYESYGL